MQMQQVQRGDLLQLGDRNVVEIVEVHHQATVEGLMTLRLVRPGFSSSWVTAPMLPTAPVRGLLRQGQPVDVTARRP